MTTVAFCEIDAKARLVLKKHWPDVPVFEDITTLTKADIHDEIDIIAGGFPCQDISLAGKGAGLAGARSGLWSEFHRLIAEIRPRYAIIENVSALRNRGLDTVLRSLAEIGYDAEWHCIPACAVGAPHKRDRIWIVAYPDNKPTEGGRQRGRLGGAGMGQETGDTYWGKTHQPSSLGMADGVPKRVDRLKQLGNAVVPQIPELIGRAIMDYENALA
jgi:DNA (cytosine-5)-methyltransferase 1